MRKIIRMGIVLLTLCTGVISMALAGESDGVSVNIIFPDETIQSDYTSWYVEIQNNSNRILSTSNFKAKFSGSDDYAPMQDVRFSSDHAYILPGEGLCMIAAAFESEADDAAKIPTTKLKDMDLKFEYNQDTHTTEDWLSREAECSIRETNGMTTAVTVDLENYTDGYLKYDMLRIALYSEDHSLIYISEIRLGMENIVIRPRGKVCTTWDLETLCNGLSQEGLNELRLHTVNAKAYISISVPDQDQYSYVQTDDKNAELMRYHAKNSTSVYIPPIIDGYMVQSIGRWCFTSLETIRRVSIPEGVENIDRFALADMSSLEQICLPSTLCWTGWNPFVENPKLTNFTFHAGNPNFVVKDGMLIDSQNHILVCYPEGLRDSAVIIPTGIRSIGEYAFRGNSTITAVFLQQGVITIGECAFEDCENLYSVILPESLEEIANDAFQDCRVLQKINLPASVQSIQGEPFYHCDALKVETIPGSYGDTYCTEHGLWQEGQEKPVVTEEPLPSWL